MPDAPDKKTVAKWCSHRQDEADAAFLYRLLTELESRPSEKDLYRRLAEVEDRHTLIWTQLLAEYGIEEPVPEPSLRARLLAWIASRFGPGTLLSLLLREEGLEVQNYLSLYHESDPGNPRSTALKLARESAQHAETLSHMAKSKGEPWHHTGTGGFLRNVIYGFNDGLTANFGLVAGVIGAAVDPGLILVTGLAGALADALSMGASGYLAAKSEAEVHANEIAMERDEILMMPEVEEEELALIYESRGMSREKAEEIARDVIASPEKALEEMVREELKISAPHTTPLKEGWITGAATAVGAFIPVFPFFAFSGLPAAWTSFALSMFAHFAVGAARSVFTGRGLLRSGFDMFVVGFGVAAVGYLAGDLLVHWLF